MASSLKRDVLKDASSRGTVISKQLNPMKDEEYFGVPSYLSTWQRGLPLPSLKKSFLKEASLRKLPQGRFLKEASLRKLLQGRGGSNYW